MLSSIVGYVLLSLHATNAFLAPTTTTTTQSTALYSNNNYNSHHHRHEDLFAAVHRKEYEMKQVNQQHSSVSDPVRMAIGYMENSVPRMRLAKALRRVHEMGEPDPNFNPKYDSPIGGDDDEAATGGGQATNIKKDIRSAEEVEREQKLKELGMKDAGMRRASFIVDIKRKSLSRPGEMFCNFDDAGLVADAMVRLGADVVFVNTDYAAYGGDLSELKSAVRAVRKVSKTAAVVMKDIVVDEIQLGLAKEAGADGVLLIASVLGPALDNFLNLATTMALETIVECHTTNEVNRAIEALAQNILVSNYDRVDQKYYPKQAIRMAGLFPGSGGPIITLACGDISDVNVMRKHLAVGYDGVVVGKAVMGSARAPEFIKACRNRQFLPAELSQWGLEDVEFDEDGNIIPSQERDVPEPREFQQ